MTLKNRQKLYRIRSPDLKWIKKTEAETWDWTDDESDAYLWRKLHHLRSDLGQFGSLRVQLERLLDGLPEAALEVIELQVKLQRTNRSNRTHQLVKFQEFDLRSSDLGCEHMCSHGLSALQRKAHTSICTLCGKEIHDVEKDVRSVARGTEGPDDPEPGERSGEDSGI